MAELEPEEFQRWSDIYYKASTSLEIREKNVDDAAELIEKVGRLSIAERSLFTQDNLHSQFPVLDTSVFLILIGTYLTLSSYIVCFCLHYRICFCWEPLLSRTSCRRLV